MSEKDAKAADGNSISRNAFVSKCFLFSGPQTTLVNHSGKTSWFRAYAACMKLRGVNTENVKKNPSKENNQKALHAMQPDARASRAT